MALRCTWKGGPMRRTCTSRIRRLPIMPRLRQGALRVHLGWVGSLGPPHHPGHVPSSSLQRAGFDVPSAQVNVQLPLPDLAPKSGRRFPDRRLARRATEHPPQ